ncbi:hypothetical protein BN6_61360 [Saccharothrix espanaensis DSM 44229]|uniref:CATRA-Associated Small Protein domain-containing protein n=1 Tax=Saccharothrix espanaensis (strain ATCC 51144 / DSM 44229 / JCM 9112 / NBRC 15066 / NRRL 15764) TaxID=1179773 RepID=K0K9S9_SACES|nr:hypothetical protein BN6_61360 [Saccharothrix espanaensis DSM 44229]
MRITWPERRYPRSVSTRHVSRFLINRVRDVLADMPELRLPAERWSFVAETMGDLLAAWEADDEADFQEALVDLESRAGRAARQVDQGEIPFPDNVATLHATMVDRMTNEEDERPSGGDAGGRPR